VTCVTSCCTGENTSPSPFQPEAWHAMSWRHCSSPTFPRAIICWLNQAMIANAQTCLMRQKSSESISEAIPHPSSLSLSPFPSFIIISPAICLALHCTAKSFGIASTFLFALTSNTRIYNISTTKVYYCRWL
jgi:hypothetical protein